MHRRIRHTFLLIAAIAVIAASVAACGNDDTGNDGPSSGMIATFRVADRESYRILLTDPEMIEQARQWLAGEMGPFIPNGKVVRGSEGVNEGWSWHIDPNDVEFAEMTVEVCDGVPSDVEDEIITSNRFCPWLAQIVSLEAA